MPGNSRRAGNGRRGSSIDQGGARGYILVNNLGVHESKPFASISDVDWHHIFEVNVVSGARFTRHYFPKMLERNWDRVIFVASESALLNPREMVHYGMTKCAQLAVARGLAKQARGIGVTVNSVLPGLTRSEGVATFIAPVTGARLGAAGLTLLDLADQALALLQLS